MAELPPQKLLVRVPDTASLVTVQPPCSPSNGSPIAQSLLLSSMPAANASVWSADGALLALMSTGVVTVHDTNAEEQVARLEVPGVMAAAFSPRGTYLATFQRTRPDAGNTEKNLKLWDWRAGQPALMLFQKAFSREAWPSLQLLPDESLALHVVTNAINVYNPRDFAAGVLKKLPLKGVGGCAVSPSAGAPALAAFVPEAKGAPGFVGVWRMDQLGAGGDAPTPVARRTFFRASSVTLMWNASGTALLAMTASETDATNQSYYGEQKLHFLAADGSLDCLVPVPKEGPIHDVQWSPRGDLFVTVAGFMPAKSTIFTAACKPHYDLGSGPHNLARWSPQARPCAGQGRFLAIAGFGNLPGDVALYDRKADGKFRPMGSARVENGVTLEWAPDGRLFLTATVAPRLRVDNGFHLYRYDGAHLHAERREVLLEAAWRPAPPGTFPERPPSPRAAANGAAGRPAAPPVVAQRPKGYVPPSRRGNPDAAASGSFSLAYDPADSRGRLGGPTLRTLPPGAAPPETKAASRNSRRRRAKGGKPGAGDAEGAEADAGLDPDAKPAEGSAGGGGAGGSAATQNGSGAREGNGHAAALAAEAPADRGAGGSNSSTPVAHADAARGAAKRARALQKKLRQVAELRERAAAGEKLGVEQREKLAGEAALLAEVHELGVRD